MNLPSSILYNSPNNYKKFELEKFEKSLSSYGDYDRDLMFKLLDEKSHYAKLHHSCLVEIGTKCLLNEESAKAYYDDHHKVDSSFERLRRITGYLVGTLDRWNDGKRAEEKDRVKHNIPTNKNGIYTQEEKSLREEAKLDSDHMLGTI